MTTQTQIQIPELTRTALCEIDPYRQGTSELAPAHVLIDLDSGEVDVDTYSSGQGVIERMWYGEIVTCDVPTAADGGELTALLRADEGQALIARVLDNTETYTASDGRERIGLTDAGVEAIDALGEYLEDCETVDCWQAGDWLASNESLHRAARGCGVTARVSDARLAAIATEQEAEALSDGIVLLDDIEPLLIDARESMRRAARERARCYS